MVNPYVIAGILVIAVLMLYGGIPASFVSNPDARGSFMLTQIDACTYKAELLDMSDNGRAINFYWQRSSPANLETNYVSHWTNLPDIGSSKLVPTNVQMFLSTPCIKSPVKIISPLEKVYSTTPGTSSTDWQYRMAIGRGISLGQPENDFCGNSGRCTSDCEGNVGSNTEGYIIFTVDSTACQQQVTNPVNPPSSQPDEVLPDEPTPTPFPGPTNVFDAIMQFINSIIAQIRGLMGI